MWIVTSFDTGYGPATGLNPIIRIRKVDDGSVVASGVMSELGDGFYTYDFTNYDITENYVILCDAINLPSNKRYKALSSGEYGNIINNIGIVSDNVDLRVLLIRKIFTNKLDFVDGSSNNWVLYDDDNITELIKWDITDKNDEEIIQRDSDVSGRSKGG